MTRRRIAVATCDAITPKMAGPAIRAWQMAEALSAEHDVQLVTTTVASVSHPGFPVRAVDDRIPVELTRHVELGGLDDGAIRAIEELLRPDDSCQAAHRQRPV